jgi:polyisoprenoid-binding protein YceI
MRVVAVAGFVGAILIACGGAPAAAPSPTPTATPTPSPSPTATTTGSAGAWTVSDRSKATVRVREQLVGVSLPSDAVLTATGAQGSFEINQDGTFTSGSKITFDMNTMSSDSRDRDNFIKNDTLRVRQFPTAEFVPVRTTGLTLPLQTSGSFTFKLIGNMTIRGTTKEVTFDVEAVRNGGELTATVTANPSWKFGEFGMTAPSVPFRVVSIVDEIRVAIDLVASSRA